MIRNVAGTKRILTDMVVDRRLLLGVRCLTLHRDRLDQSLEIFAPELRAIRGSLVEWNLFGYADKLHILQRDDLVSHTFSLLC